MSSLRLEDHLLHIAEGQAVVQSLLDQSPEQWEWEVSLEAAELSFLESRTGRILYSTPVQLIGTLDRIESTFQWAWLNPGFPEAVVKRLDSVRELAPSGSDARFLAEAPLRLTAEARFALVTVVAGALGAFTYYAIPSEDTVAFFALEQGPEIDLPRTPQLAIQTVNTCITSFAFHHREALQAYLGAPRPMPIGEALIFRAGSGDLMVTFDDRGRIAQLEAYLPPSTVPELAIRPAPPEPAPAPKQGLFQKLRGRR